MSTEPASDDDVTAHLREQRRLAENALRDSSERLRLAVEAGQLGIWDWDIAADYVTWSDRVYELHGVARGAFGGRVADFAMLVHPQDRDAVQAGIARALAGGAAYEVEFRVMLPDGAIRWLATRAHVVRNPSGGAVRMVGATYDVTPRVELLAAERVARAAAEGARRRLELLAAAGTELSRSLHPAETLAAVAASVVPGIADWCRVDLIDENGILQRALTHHADPERSREGAALVQRLRAAPFSVGSMAWTVATGRSHLADFVPPTSFDHVGDRDLLTFAESIGMRAYFIVPLIARGRTLGALAALQAESGRTFSADDCAMIVELGQRVALALDNARLFAQAERALREAERASQAKDEFLAMLGHELRNPLAPITMALHLMEMRGDVAFSDERRVIERQVTHLSRLVDDLLDVSRITQGKIQLQWDRIEIGSVVAKAVELTAATYAARGRPLDLVAPASPVHVRGDAIRLAQVICNLLTNAAKFSPPDARVSLTVAVAGPDVEVRVADEGSGIPADLLPRVFDLFVQGHQRIDRSAGGLGLGLGIVKTLVQMHGGTVTAASEGLDRGSEFVVRLPLALEFVEGITTNPPAPCVNSRVGRVLVVDDNADAADTLVALMRIGGHDARGARDGVGALAILDVFIPDVAILDIGLPDMDGYELAGRLRADARTRDVTLIALTGYGRAPDRKRALEAGFDEHLVKPVDPPRLLQLMEEWLR